MVAGVGADASLFLYMNHTILFLFQAHLFALTWTLNCVMF